MLYQHGLGVVVHGLSESKTTLNPINQSIKLHHWLHHYCHLPLPPPLPPFIATIHSHHHHRHHYHHSLPPFIATTITTTISATIGSTITATIHHRHHYHHSLPPLPPQPLPPPLPPFIATIHSHHHCHHHYHHSLPPFIATTITTTISASTIGSTITATIHYRHHYHHSLPPFIATTITTTITATITTNTITTTTITNEIWTYSDSLYIPTEKVHVVLSKNTANFSIFSVNIQSLNSKFDSLLAMLSDPDDKNLHFHAICIQETWLSKDCDTSLFAIPGYHMVHHGLGRSKHSGLVIYLSDQFSYTIKDVIIQSDLWDGQFIDVHGENLRAKLTIGNIYRPPPFNDNNSTLKQFLSELDPVL